MPKSINALLLVLCTSVFAQQTLNYPWVTFNDLFDSEIVINNLDMQTAQVTLTATRSSGENQTAMRTIEPASQWVEGASSLFPDFEPGSGFSVMLNSESNAVTGSFRVFGRGTASGNSPAQASVVSLTDASNIQLFNYLPIPDSAPANSAVVVVNTSDVEANVTFWGFSASQPAQQVTYQIPPQQPLAQLVTDLFPGTTGSMYVITEGDQPLTGMAFIFNEYLEPSMDNPQPLASMPNLDYGPQELTVSSLPLVEPLSIENLVLDDEGTMYAVEGYANSRAFRIAADGSSYEVIAENLGGPNGIARDSNGNLYITEFNTSQLTKISADGVVSTFAALEVGPQNVTVDANDHIYVSYWGSGNGTGNQVSHITPAGVVTTYAQGISVPNGLAFDDENNLYVVTTFNGLVKRVAPDGTITDFSDLPGSGIIGGTMIWAEGKLFVTGVYGNKIFQIEDGVATHIAGTGTAGSIDGLAFEAQFDSPLGLAYNAQKRQLYITSVGITAPAIRIITLP